MVSALVRRCICRLSSQITATNDIAGLVLSGGYGHRTSTSLALAVLEAGRDAAIGEAVCGSGGTCARCPHHRPY